MEPEKKELREIVFEALGEASTCWSETPTWIFDSTNAKRIGNELMAKINSDLPNAMKVLIAELEKDKSEGSYYFAWQANIAVSFQDAYSNFLQTMKLRIF